MPRSPPVSTIFSMPEMRVRPHMEKFGDFVSNMPLTTKYRIWPIYPDIRFLKMPLIVEVDGVHWHTKKLQRRKDVAKDECYMGEGFYVVRVTDTAVNRDMENFIKAFGLFVEEITNERFDNPRVWHYPSG